MTITIPEYISCFFTLSAPFQRSNTSPGLRFEINAAADARYAALVDDEQHVHAGNSLRLVCRRGHLQASGGTALRCECELHVPIAGCQAVGVVIAAKEDHRPDVTRAAGDSEIEASPVRDLPW